MQISFIVLLIFFLTYFIYVAPNDVSKFYPHFRQKRYTIQKDPKNHYSLN